jgi:hypothetical protein
MAWSGTFSPELFLLLRGGRTLGDAPTELIGINLETN